jgi:hypothetical protein
MTKVERIYVTDAVTTRGVVNPLGSRLYQMFQAPVACT